jgi:replication factor C large subunit
VNYKTVKDVLLRILENEKIFLNPDTIAEISIKARGDIRAAINDLQKEAHGSPGTKEVKIDERDKEKDIFNVLREIFKNKPSRESLELFDSLSMGIDEVMLWIEKNIPLEYRGKELEKAFDLLSRADVFRGRIYRQQYWRFLVYENFFLSYGISASKSKERFSGGFTSYKRPDRILKIWLNNRKTERKKSIAEKYARHAHIGKKRAESEFPIIAMFLKNPEIQRELGLDTGEIEYLNS